MGPSASPAPGMGAQRAEQELRLKAPQPRQSWGCPWCTAGPSLLSTGAASWGCVLSAPQTLSYLRPGPALSASSSTHKSGFQQHVVTGKGPPSPPTPAHTMFFPSKTLLLNLPVPEIPSIPTLPQLKAFFDPSAGLGTCLFCTSMTSFTCAHQSTNLQTRSRPACPTGLWVPPGRNLVGILPRPIASSSPGLGTEKSLVPLSMAQRQVDLRRAPSQGSIP